MVIQTIPEKEERRKQMQDKYHFHVPEQKKVRYIVHTDCKNEADDQYTLAHILMTQKLDVRGIIGGHFAHGFSSRFPEGGTAQASCDEIEKILELMDLKGKYPVLCGSGSPLSDSRTPIDTPAACFIIEEAMRDDPRPLFIGMQGALTDLACAIMMEPAICSRMTCIWIGGGNYPEGGWEFNLAGDVRAANIVFSSSMPLWQVPMGTYKLFNVSLTELQKKVMPCGAVGKYLFEQMVCLNDELADSEWPHGESWCLGDEGVVAALLQDSDRPSAYFIQNAPLIREDMTYVPSTKNRAIRIYTDMDARLTLEDLFCKLYINYGS